MQTLTRTQNGMASEKNNRKKRKGQAWIIALLIAVLAILTLNFGAACAWLMACGASALTAVIIMTVIIVIIATVLLVFLYQNPDWLQELADDTGSALSALGSGLGKAAQSVLSGTSSGLAGFVPTVAPWVLGGLALWLLLSKKES